ncbi:hypothetical protein VU08_06770 [Desulfobulbus sp. F5]|nr:hypothetical protein [Desulfobulbus sp. F5]
MLAQDALSIIKRSPGLNLVLIGFTVIFLIANLALKHNTSPQIIYLTFAFSFLVALSGIVLMFGEMRKENLALEATSSVATASDLEMAVTQLGKNYDILRQQATQGFMLAAIFMALGVLVILTGAVGDMFGFKKEASNLTTVAGVVVEAISGLGMYLFNRTFQQLNTTSDRLHELWKLLAAFKRAEALPENDRRTVIVDLIKKLVESSAPAQIT